MSPEAFMKSDAYKDYQKSTEGMIGTMDMYQSPYFGGMSSGSIGRGQDKAYEDWKASQTTPGYGAAAQQQQALINSMSGAPQAPLGQSVPDASQMPEEGFESWQQSPQKAPAMPAPAPTQQAPQPVQQPAQSYGPYAGYAPGTMQAGMGPGEQIAAEASVAGPTGLQQRAYETAYNMQTPGQYGQATDIARTAGLGLLNTAGQAQGLQNLGLGALEQGRQYARDITDPFRTQQFMSPYMQNVVNAQQRDAKRQSDIMALSQRAQAAKSGAFGGSGRAIMEAERRRNLATQLGDIQAQGLQSAYQNAQQQQLLAQQQAMQGYTTGIQGYGQGITGQTGAFGQATGAGGTLGNLGGQQLGSQQSIANLQNLYGQQLQQNRQNVLNQAMQNYNMQRMYPQQQLQYLSGLLSGLPVSSTGQVANIPGPNMLSQLAGLGTTAVGAYGLYNKMFPGGKKGGNVRSNPGGGIASIGLRKALNQ